MLGIFVTSMICLWKTSKTYLEAEYTMREPTVNVFLKQVWFDLHSETFYSYISYLCDPTFSKLGWPNLKGNISFYVGPAAFVSKSFQKLLSQYSKEVCGSIIIGEPPLNSSTKVFTIITTTYPGDFNNAALLQLVNNSNFVIICHASFAHEIHENFESSSNVYWLTPAHRNHVVPSKFPSFLIEQRNSTIRKSIQSGNPPIFVIQGDLDRRNIFSLISLLHEFKNESFILRFVGKKSELPTFLNFAKDGSHRGKIQMRSNTNAEEFAMNMTEAFAILPLVDETNYFGFYEHGKKLTSSLMWGLGLKMNIIIFKPLAELFKLQSSQTNFFYNDSTDLKSAFGLCLRQWKKAKKVSPV